MFTEFTPRFVKRYADLAGILADAARAYAADVRERRFPAPEHCVPGDPKADTAA